MSEDTKDLLRNLLTADPRERISWQEFFNHKLFQHTDTNDPLLNDNSANVEKEFINNMVDCEQNPKNLDLKDFKSQNTSTKISNSYFPSMLSSNSSDSEKKMAFREYGFRYYHEKNKIMMIFLTVRRLRQLMKDSSFKDLDRYVYLLIAILAKKGSMLSDLTLMSLKMKNNIFKLPFFEDFTESEEYQDVIKQLMDDQKSIVEYKNYISNISKEVILSGDDYKLLKDLQEGFIDLGYLDEKARNFYLKIRETNERTKIPQLTENMQHLYLTTMIFCIYSIMSESYMPYMTSNDQKFEWESFKGRHEKSDSIKLWSLLETLTNEFLHF